MVAAVHMDGRAFGSLSVIGPAPARVDSTRHRLMWRCLCICSKETVVEGSALRGGQTTSCGCQKRALISAKNLRHGESYGDRVTAEFRSWQAMLGRCGNPNNKSFPLYGGRGVAVCERWKVYEQFLADMGRRPTAAHSIDRIAVNGNYEPRNCRWATKSEQARNRRTSIMVDVLGRRLPLMTACEERGLSYSTVLQRLRKLGWPVSRALELGGAS